MTKNFLGRRSLIKAGGATLLLGGLGLSARPAFSQKAAYFAPNGLADMDLVPGKTAGDALNVDGFETFAHVQQLSGGPDSRQPFTLLGRVFDASKTAVDFGDISFWQTNPSGLYLDDAFRGSTHLRADGSFAMAATVPTAYLNAEGQPRAPHLHVSVFAPYAASTAFQTELFFEGDTGIKAQDPDYLAANEIEFERQADGSLIGYYNIFLG